MADPLAVERLAQEFRNYIRAKAGLQGPEWLYVSMSMRDWYRELARRALTAPGA